MNATLSTHQLRLVGLLVLVVVAAAGYMVVAKHKSTTQPSTAHSTTPVSTPAQTTPAPSKPHKHSVTPVKLNNTHGLPVRVARALRKHAVVVVSLVQPGADVDTIAAAEAKAGADEMGAGFVRLNVRHQGPGTAILHKLGVLSTPAVLVVKRSGLVYSEFNKGFVDRDVVAQAVADARR
jgi:hypothetical protein